MTRVIQRPHLYCFSKNQILWRFEVDTPGDPGCMLDVYISVVGLNGIDDNVSTYQTQLKPDNDGICNVYLQDIIDSMIDYEFPDPVGGQVQYGKNLKRVTLKFRRITTADPSPAWNESEYSHTRYVVKGGIELLKHDHNNYFKNVHAINKPFATWLPKYCFVGLTDKFWISILFTGITTSTGERVLKVTAEFTNNTTEVISIPIPSVDDVYGLYHIMAGAGALGINDIAAGRQLWRYSLQVTHPTSHLIVFSETYMFYIDYRLFYNTQLFSYYNSLGGLDFVRILGDIEDDYQRNFTETEMFTGSLLPGSPPASAYKQTNITRYNSYKGDTGLRHTPAQVMALQELLCSELIWQQISDRLYQVWLLNKGDKLKKKTDKKWNLPLEWRYGFVEQVYTPADTDLGTGEDLETYG